MQKWNNWMDWFKDIPNWIRNAIGLITLIISFVLLFKSNWDLSILVSAIAVLLFLLFLSVYLIFTKGKSTLVGGGYIYRFPVARKWALVMIVPIITSVLFVGSNRTTRDATVALFTSNKKVLDCHVVLGFPERQTTVSTDDKSQLLNLIDAEATSVLYQDLSQVMTIFTDESLIVDVSTGEQWEGCKEIQFRYTILLRNIAFTSLQHKVNKVSINGNMATVETVTNAFYDGIYYIYNADARRIPNLHAEGVNRWTFIKYNGVWKLKTFVMGLPIDSPARSQPRPIIVP